MAAEWHITYHVDIGIGSMHYYNIKFRLYYYVYIRHYFYNTVTRRIHFPIRYQYNNCVYLGKNTQKKKLLPDRLY